VAYFRDVIRSARHLVWMMAENPYLPIIGVVGDVSGRVCEQACRSRPWFYSHAGMTWSRCAVRAREPAESMVKPVTSYCTSSIRRLAVSRSHHRHGRWPKAARERISALISTSFGSRACCWRPLGLYGLSRFSVAKRDEGHRHPIALCARRHASRIVVAGGSRLVAIGAAMASAARCCSCAPRHAAHRPFAHVADDANNR